MHVVNDDDVVVVVVLIAFLFSTLCKILSLYLICNAVYTFIVPGLQTKT